MSELLFIAVHGLLLGAAFLVGSPALGPLGSVAVAQGLIAPQPLESSWTRDQTPVPWIGGWILAHGATREVALLVIPFKYSSVSVSIPRLPNSPFPPFLTLLYGVGLIVEDEFAVKIWC